MKKTTVIMMCLGMLLLGTGIAYADITTGLIAYYSFTGNAVDSVGGNNGTVYGTTPLTTDRFGQPNSAYYFNGSDSHIELNHTFDFINMGSNLTFSAWIKSDGGGTIFYQGNNGEAWLRAPDGQADFTTHLANSSWYSATDTATLPQDKFVNITGVYYAHQKIEIWVNSNLITTTNLADSDMFYVYWGAWFPANIGAYHDLWRTDLILPFKGTIDDLRIYDRALTQADIQELAANNVPLPGAVWLLGSGLLGLVGRRKLRKG